MSNPVETAVTSVTPASKSRRPSRLDTAPAAAINTPAPALHARKGRAPLVLKGGKLWSEARDEAKQAVAVAKAALRDAKAALAGAEKALAGALRTAEKGAKSVSKTSEALAKAPKDAALKQAAKDAVTVSKMDANNVKQAQKIRDAANKAVEKANAGVTKANEALAKVEAAKADAKPAR
jgi:hypothetical protein